MRKPRQERPPVTAAPSDRVRWQDDDDGASAARDDLDELPLDVAIRRMFGERRYG